MERKSIKETIMKRDSLSEDEADDLIAEAREQFMEYIESGDMEAAGDICGDYFCLEPDYLDEFI